MNATPPPDLLPPDLRQLEQVAQFYNISIQSPENPEDRKARLDRDNAEARVRRIKDLTIFIVAVGTSIIIGGSCLWIIVSGRFQADIVDWAKNLILMMFPAFIAYIVGKKGDR